MQAAGPDGDRADGWGRARAGGFGGAGPIADLLCRTAVEIVGTAGLEALTDEALVARAGVRAETLRRHFGTAEACLLIAFDAAMLEAFATFRAPFDEIEDWDEALLNGWLALQAWVAARPDLARLTLCEILRGDNRMRSHRDAARIRVVALLTAEHRARHGSDDLPATQFELLCGAVFQAWSQWWEEGRLGDLSSLEPELDRLLAVFGPAPA
jgi:AcrR family transcriptional regulator